jgi:hypothetical protein
MKQENSESKKDSAESIFNEFVERGDDFYKIQLLRQAIAWYRKAYDINNKNETVLSRITECERLLAFETKVVYILLFIVSILLFIYFILIK